MFIEVGHSKNLITTNRLTSHISV